jgi:hypothetical protein
MTEIKPGDMVTFSDEIQFVVHAAGANLGIVTKVDEGWKVTVLWFKVDKLEATYGSHSLKRVA